jgi:aminopeptidase-like protein
MAGDSIHRVNAEKIGQEIYDFIVELFPICRSITGNGLRQTLGLIKKRIPLEIHEVPTGTKVFDWTVPKEWDIRDGYVKNRGGEKIIDFQKSNLHLLNYSVPIKKTVSLGELKEHLSTLPDHPEWIPYKTSYYKEDWGFCMSHREFLGLEEREYEVFIDATLENGSLTYGELYLQGEEEGEILISCHACHPSLANDNLSGVSLAVSLATRLRSLGRRYSYRFLFIPGTIGAIAWLALNEEKTGKIKHGLVLAGLGDSGNITYKKSRRGDAEIDRAALHVLRHSGDAYEVQEFSPYGYDERQYCSPGFNLPVGCLSRTPYGRYPEYHTSGDNLDLVKPECLGDSFRKVLSILEVLENNRSYLNTNPKCEPRLGKRGLYDDMGPDQLAMLWVLNFSDGEHTALSIAERASLPIREIALAAKKLVSTGLLKETGN